jgi:ABC-type nitrate/sulfonate/bicarbonate transport system ATPase subunit
MPSKLSSGQHNRFNVLRYLLQDYDLLVLDEALNNVDEPTRLSILADIKRRFPDRGFLYISHQLLDAVSFAHTLLMLRTGLNGARIIVRQGLNMGRYSPEEAGQLVAELKEIMENA